MTTSAWDIVVTNLVSGTTEVTNVTFSIGILSSILKLNEQQQLELVTDPSKRHYQKKQIQSIS